LFDRSTQLEFIIFHLCRGKILFTHAAEEQRLPKYGNLLAVQLAHLR